MDAKITKIKKKRHKITSQEIIVTIFASLGLIWLLIFAYLPMFGVALAFKSADRKIDLWGELLKTNNWVGFENFKEFLIDPKFKNVFVNTVSLNLINLAINFPAPIIFALLINEVTHKKFKSGVQTIANFPHFISWTVYGGIIIALLDVTTGIANPIMNLFGLSSNDNPVNLLSAKYFWGIVIVGNLVKGMGWGSIIYVAAISGIDPSFYESATLDGANRFQKAIYITLPCIKGTIVVFLLLAIGRILGNNFEEFWTLQNAINLKRSEVLSTYSYKIGITERRYSYSSAFSLFNSAISFTLLITSNTISKKLTGKGLY